MAVLKPRERLVYFRITEDEFNQFVGVCEQAGARSLSDLARNAVQRLIADSNRERGEQDLAPKVQSLEKLIAEVTTQLEILTKLRAAEDHSTSRNTYETQADSGKQILAELPLAQK